MLHETIAEYLQEIEAKIVNLQNVYVEKYVEEILTDTRVNLRIRLRFTTGYLLEIHEAVVLAENENFQHLDYRYHFQDDRNQLIFRYDCTPHFPDLSSFPHHKHLPNEVIAGEKPAIAVVIEEVESLLKDCC